MCLFSAAGILLTFTAAAEKSGSDLTCNVSRLPDGTFMYQLSKPPSSASCMTEWERENRTVIVNINQDFDPKLVQNLTDQYISLTICLDYLHYTCDCLEGFEEAHCTVNCSSFSETFPENLIKNSTDSSNLICFSENWCPEKLHVGLFFAIIIALILVSIGSLKFCCKCKLFKCRRQRSATETTSYTAATKEVKIDLSWVETNEDDDWVSLYITPSLIYLWLLILLLYKVLGNF